MSKRVTSVSRYVIIRKTTRYVCSSKFLVDVIVTSYSVRVWIIYISSFFFCCFDLALRITIVTKLGSIELCLYFRQEAWKRAEYMSDHRANTRERFSIFGYSRASCAATRPISKRRTKRIEFDGHNRTDVVTIHRTLRRLLYSWMIGFIVTPFAILFFLSILYRRYAARNNNTSAEKGFASFFLV